MPRERNLAKNPCHTYLPPDALAAVDTAAERRGQTRAGMIREIVLEFVERTTRASGVPTKLEDASIAEQVAAILRDAS